MKVATAFGEVDESVLVHHYELYKKNEKKKYEKRLQYLTTDEGRDWNREKSNSYYERNKDKILEKRKAKYVSRKKKSPVSNPPGEEKTA
jgi:hypothetical protein